MACPDVPPWCEHGSGTRPLLIVAPHGGRRRVEPRGDAERKVNDVHTADLARELAAALQASYVINPELDRNQLDLNRIGQVRARAPWFLALLEHLLDELLRQHARVDLLIVHGWNISQPKCDVGIGRRLDRLADAAAHAGELTVSTRYAADRLSALHAACAARGIAALFGARYPARHPNNVLQLFRRAPRTPAPEPRLARWSEENRIEAVQLELAIPLRWPGPLREAFLDAARETFDSAGVRVLREGEAAPSRVVATPPAVLGHQPSALQCYDPGADLGIVARVETTGAGVGGRLLLFIDRRTVCLFTGEDLEAAHLAGVGPHFEAEASGFRLSFRGHVLATDDGDRYVDLEDAFAASTLHAIEVDLQFRSLRTADIGSVTGTVGIDGAIRRVDTLGLGRQELLRRSGAVWRSQLRIAAAIESDRGLRIAHEFPGAGATREELTPGGRSITAITPVVVQFVGRNPTRLVAGSVSAEPISRMTIVRPATARQQARVSFGVARIADGATRGFGFYEYARVVAVDE